MIDANAYIGEWPFRRLNHAAPDALLRKMDALGIEKAVVSRLENVFYKDVMVGNRELYQIVQQHPDRLVPAYTINSAMPCWELDFKRCVEEYGMRNLRIHPNYHQFTLLEPHTTRVMDASLEAYAQYHMLTGNALALLECAKTHDLVVLLTLTLEDSRWHHWHVKVPPVTTTDAVEAICTFPDVRFLVCTGRYVHIADIWRRAYKNENVYFDVSRVQGPVDDIEQLCAQVGADHLLFGTNCPIFYPESAKLSIEYAEISDQEKELMLSANATRLFAL